jgi:hypothetical protein
MVKSHCVEDKIEHYMNSYLEDLRKTGMSLIIYKDGEIIFSSYSHGIRPHLEAIKKLGRSTLKGTVMADKIVGRAAALLILYSEADEVHALLISTGGKEVLQSKCKKIIYVEETNAIKVQDGRIFCPFEQMVQGISDPVEAYNEMIAKMAELQTL